MQLQGTAARLNPFLDLSISWSLTWRIILQTFLYALSKSLGVFYILFMNVFIMYSMRKNSAVTAVSDVTDMQPAKHSISDQEKQTSAGLWMFMLKELKTSGYIKGTRSVWLVEDDETEGMGFEQWDVLHVFISRRKTRQILCWTKSATAQWSKYNGGIEVQLHNFHPNQNEKA